MGSNSWEFLKRNMQNCFNHLEKQPFLISCKYFPSFVFFLSFLLLLLSSWGVCRRTLQIIKLTQQLISLCFTRNKRKLIICSVKGHHLPDMFLQWCYPTAAIQHTVSIREVLGECVHVCMHVSDGRGERGRDLLLEKLREKGEEKNKSTVSFFSLYIDWERLNNLLNHCQSNEAFTSTAQSYSWNNNRDSSALIGTKRVRAIRKVLLKARSEPYCHVGNGAGPTFPFLTRKWELAVLQGFTTAFCLGHNLVVGPGGDAVVLWLVR